jgi:hypothetical protein
VRVLVSRSLAYERYLIQGITWMAQIWSVAACYHTASSRVQQRLFDSSMWPTSRCQLVCVQTPLHEVWQSVGSAGKAIARDPDPEFIYGVQTRLEYNLTSDL